MPRPLVIGNGSMLLNFDNYLVLRDLYYPRVGLLNQIEGRHNRLGVFVENHFCWIDHKDWQRRLYYYANSLTTGSLLLNKRLGLRLAIDDTVHPTKSIYLRKIKVTNLESESREVRLFFANDYSISGSDIGDTVLFDPETRGLCHYKRDTYILSNAQVDSTTGFYQFATGQKKYGAEGTWRDAEDGWLEGNPIVQGAVDSVGAISIALEAKEEREVYFWIAIADSYPAVVSLNEEVIEISPVKLMDESTQYWRAWLRQRDNDRFPGLPRTLAQLYRRSLLVVMTQIDKSGGILAANDSDILAFGRDHYSYVWPRDSGLVALSLIRAGYGHSIKSFFSFCQKTISDQGFFWHKYNPDGTLGSSWHPWIKGRKPNVPIQEDETALIIIAFAKYYRQTGDWELIRDNYDRLLKIAGDFLVSFRDLSTGLPLPSYDLWEERQGIFTWTAATVYKALKELTYLADRLGKFDDSERFKKATKEIHQAILEHLYDEDLGRFIRGYICDGNGEFHKDDTVESSMAGLFLFDVLPAKDPRIVRTMRAIEKHLSISEGIGGIARYEGDYYMRQNDTQGNMAGNPWFITTLWLARWYIAIADDIQDLKPAKDILFWVQRHTFSTGIMAEQLHPFTGMALSVAPLTWSHATFVETMLDFRVKYFSFMKGKISSLLRGKHVGYREHNRETNLSQEV